MWNLADIMPKIVANVNKSKLGGGKSCPSLSCHDVNAYTIP